jgi:predicted MFS family arabinose efflux permease
MVLPFLALYVTRSLGFTPAFAGLTLAVYGVAALFTAPISGKLCDVLGPLRIMKFSFFTSGALLLAFPLVRGKGGLLAVTFLWSVLNECFRPANMALLSHLALPDQRKAAFALNRLAVNMGMSVGPAVGGVLAMISFRWLFWVDGATSLLAGLVLVLLTWGRAPVEGGPVVRHAEGASGPARGTAAFANGRFLLFLMALMPAIIVFFQLNAALPLYLVRDLNLPEADFGLIFTLNTILIILIEIPINAAMARWPHRRALALGTLLTGLGFGAMAFVSNFAGVAAVTVLWTFGEMITFPGSSAAVADMAPADRRGEYMGLYTMTFSLCFTVGPWLGSVVLERLGPTPLWIGALGLGCLSALLVARLAPAAEAA